MIGHEENYRPPEGPDYFEWKAILASVECAKDDPYVMVDLGAGFGWWGINAATALKRKAPAALGRIIMVEAEPDHYEFLKIAISDNPIPGVSFETVKAAVGPAAGQDWFYTGRSDRWYGQRLMLDYHRDHLREQRQEHVRSEGAVLKTSDNYELSQVEVATLEEILADCSHVDLLDMDIQGTELSIVQSASEVINAKCRRLFISTHSNEIHAELLTLLDPHWELLASFLPHTEVETEVGKVKLLDGVQHWVIRR
jgi:FkbM family methyltransferase